MSLRTKRQGLSRFFGALGKKWDCPPSPRAFCPQALNLPRIARHAIQQAVGFVIADELLFGRVPMERAP
jgi:hypothetical protein